MPNQDDRRVSKILWSVVSKAADRSKRQRKKKFFCEHPSERYVIFHEIVRLERFAIITVM